MCAVDIKKEREKKIREREIEREEERELITKVGRLTLFIDS